MIKILTIIGTRPEAIKMSPVIIELKKYPDIFETKVCSTSQHREMLDQVLSIFNLIPDIDLNLMEANQTLYNLTSRIIIELGRVLSEEKPNILLVQGDTTTVMTASLAAFYNKIPVGHVEAGLRTTNRYSPFPEEMNRRLTSVLSDFHFAPTIRAEEALLREGIPKEKIFITGNTVIDALFCVINKPQNKIVEKILRSCSLFDDNKKLILVTAHRRENFGQPFEEICRGLKAIAERNKDIVIVYPVHLNPNVREPVFRILNNVDRVHLIEPIEYDTIAHLMEKAFIILTDSGGIQEEAPALGKPVLVLRTETERPEAVELGVAKIIGPYCESIVQETERLIYDQKEYLKMAKKVSPYGDGKAAIRIVNILKNFFMDKE
ncbi:MAG: UDP-N-acetylglucosamine 2-epimerase (non-hydrolyzing) [Desulfobacterales bacterium]|nr:UDP-N-acetylglucosamine 2-epimerase (non-hydrolyzing) [Desulfobacterales bacterium]